MSTPKGGVKVLRFDEVRRVSQPIMLEPMSGADSSENCMAVSPVLRDDEIVGIDIRCNCGSRVMVECVYEEAEE